VVTVKDFVFFDEMGGFSLSAQRCRECKRRIDERDLIAVEVKTGHWLCVQCDPDFNAWATSA
jgi:recombinational DNA repair protein (RecF pathway)